jgi:hypothetical protein
VGGDGRHGDESSETMEVQSGVESFGDEKYGIQIKPDVKAF